MNDMVTWKTWTVVALLCIVFAPAVSAADNKSTPYSGTTRSLERTSPDLQRGTTSKDTIVQQLEERINQLEQRVMQLESAAPMLASGSSEITIEDDEIVIRAERLSLISERELEVEAGDGLTLRSGKGVTMQSQQGFELKAGTVAKFGSQGRLDIKSAAPMNVEAPQIKLNKGTKPVLGADIPPSPSTSVFVP